MMMNEPEIVQKRREDSNLKVYVSEIKRRRKGDTPRV
jgi:hypothetical protein